MAGRKLVDWVKTKLGVTELESEVTKLKGEINRISIDKASHTELYALEKELNRHTRTDIDMQTKGRSYICISGKWKGNDYVEVIPIESKDFEHMMHYIKDIRAFDKNNRLDAPFQFKGMF